MYKDGLYFAISLSNSNSTLYFLSTGGHWRRYLEPAQGPKQPVSRSAAFLASRKHKGEWHAGKNQPGSLWNQHTVRRPRCGGR